MTKFEKQLHITLDSWFARKKMLSRDDYKMLKNIIHEAVNK